MRTALYAGIIAVVGGIMLYTLATRDSDEAVLFIASQQIQGLKDIFARSEWANGVWTQSAVRIKGAKGGRHVGG